MDFSILGVTKVDQDIVETLYSHIEPKQIQILSENIFAQFIIMKVKYFFFSLFFFFFFYLQKTSIQ